MVPLNHRLSTPELLNIVEDCQPKILLYDAASAVKAEAILERYPDLHLIACDRERGLCTHDSGTQDSDILLFLLFFMNTKT